MRGSHRSLVLAVALLATYGATRAVQPVPPAVRPALAAIPLTMASWNGMPAPPLDPAIAQTLAADDYVRRYYLEPRAGAPDGSRAVEMDVAYYAQPRVGARMHSPLNCLPGTGWQVTRLDTVPLRQLGEDVRIQALTVERGDRRFAMAYWVQSRDRIATGELALRFNLLRDALQRKPTDAGLVRVMAPLLPGTNADEAVIAFATRLVPELKKVLDS